MKIVNKCYKKGSGHVKSLERSVLAEKKVASLKFSTNDSKVI